MNRRAAISWGLFVLATYVNDVKPILDNHCVECHSLGNRLNLSAFPFHFAETSDQTIIVDKMLSKVQSTPPAMPPGNRPKLVAAEVSQVLEWRNGGLKP